MSPRVRIIVLTFVGLVLPCSAMAQWTEQTIHLEPGWNAVFFEVEPSPRDCDSVFQGIAVESVWGWNRRFRTVRFLQNPSTLLPEQPEWLTYFPPGSDKAHLTDLFIIRGGCPYLVKLGGSAAVDLTVKGQPVVRSIPWVPDSFNLVGFYVEDAAPPTVADFFKASPAHAPPRIHRLDAAGDWQAITDTTAVTLRRGEAYWVYCKEPSDYQGPLRVSFGASGGGRLSFARALLEHSLRIENVSDADRTITIRQRTSAAPPADNSLPALAGDVPLSYFEFHVPPGATNPDRYGWYDLPDPLSVSVPAAQTKSVRLAVRRPDMSPYTPAAGRDALYQCLLEISDGAGCRFTLPVSAKGMGERMVSPPATASAQGLGDGPAARQRATDDVSQPDHTGLWVGYASVDAVSNPTSGIHHSDEPTTAASPFTFRLIVHVDTSGTARLLQQVLQMWKEGAWIPNPDDPTGETFVLDKPGYTVLLTDDSLVSEYGGTVLRDTKLVGRRISSAAFPTSGPIVMAGGPFGDASGAPTVCEIVLDYRDVRNPFVHQYHPHHDNLTFRPDREPPYPEGVESYTITREIALAFSETDPEGLVSSAWGDVELGGTYTETIQGLHRDPIRVKGTFRLQRLCDVGVLNDGR